LFKYWRRASWLFALTTNIIGTESEISVAVILGSSDGASKTAPAIDPAKPFDLYMIRRGMRGMDRLSLTESSHAGVYLVISSTVLNGICSGTTLQSMDGFILSALS
jgi:hypothetical protein